MSFFYAVFIFLSILPLEDSNIAIGRVFSKFENIIIKITVIGTHKNIPTTPQILPHKANENKTTSALKFNDRPINLGSIMFPIKN